MSVPKPPIDYRPLNGVNTWVGTGLKKDGVVLHIMQGSLAGADSWFRNPAAQASANYGIDLDGHIVCWIDPFGKDAPFCHGNVNQPTAAFATWLAAHPGNPNNTLIGIEHAGFSGNPTQFTPAQFHASTWLTAWLFDQMAIPFDELHIWGHGEIDSVTRARCPGLDRAGWVAYEAAVNAFLTGPVPVPPQPAPEDPRIAQVRTVLSGLKAQVSTLESVLNKAPALIADAFERGSKGEA